MKRSIYTLVIMFLLTAVAYNSYAQCRLTVAELENMTKTDANAFDRFVTKKGFVKKKSAIPDEEMVVKWYACGKPNFDHTADQINWGPDPGNRPVIQYATTDKAYFESLKKAMLGMKYRFNMDMPMSVSNIPTTQHIYVSDKYFISLYSYTMADKSTWHTFQVSQR